MPSSVKMLTERALVAADLFLWKTNQTKIANYDPPSELQRKVVLL
jgi:hypothetical protein